MALVVGLDIGTKTLTGAVFSGNAKKFRLVDFFTEEIRGLSSGEYKEDGEYIAPLSIEELLQKVVRERNLKHAEVIAAVEAKDCVIREISVPFTRDDQIRKTVLFEAEGHFTGFDLEDAILEYIKTGEHDGKSQLIVAALKHEVMERRLALFRGAEIDPVAVDLDAAALYNTFAVTPMFDPTRATLVVDMGIASTKILLIEKGELKKVRSLRLHAVANLARMLTEPAAVGAAGREVTVEVVGGGVPPAFAGDYSIESRLREIENALRLLDAEGETPDDAPIAILTDEEYASVRADVEAGNGSGADASGSGEAPPDYSGRLPGQSLGEPEFDFRAYLERVAVEIQRSLAATRLDSPVELIAMTGGMSRHEEARRYLSEEFDIETVALEFGDAFAAGPNAEDGACLGTHGAVAVGLALKAFQRDRLGLDFRKGPFRYEHKFERVKVPLLVTALLLFLFFLQATFWSFHKWKEESKRLDLLRAQSRETYEAFFGEALKGDRPLAQAQRKKSVWKSGGAGDIPRFVDCVDAVKSFAKAIKDSGVKYFTIQSMDFKFRIATREVRRRSGGPGGGRTERVDSVAPSLVSIVTDDPGAHVKIENNLEQSADSVFDAQVKSVRSQEPGKNTIDLELTVKPAKLKQYQ